jgi:hypothetical protein
MKKTFLNRAAVIVAVASLASASVFAVETKSAAVKTAAKPVAVKPAAATAAPAAAPVAAPALAVPAMNISKYGEGAKDAFTVTWNGEGTNTYTLDRASCDKNGNVTGAFTAVASTSDAAKKFTATDIVEAGKYYKYRLSASDGKTTVNGALSAVESSVVAPAAAPKAAAPKAAVPAAKTPAKKTK